MKKLLLLFVIFLNLSPFYGMADGIKFEKGLSWTQIKEKAKKENKYIFIDGFTTWCVPCKVMTKEVFPQDKVGAFFNANFINVAVQFDVTSKDAAEIKKWYKDAVRFKNLYKVEVYPTYFFFNPQGELVHTVTGGSGADEFIVESKKALDPASQYNLLKRQYDAGKRNPDFLHAIAKASLKGGDHSSMYTIVNLYLATQRDLSTEENIKFALAATRKISDPGFKLLRSNSQKVDSIAGKGRSSELASSIIQNDLIYPSITDNGTVTYYGGGMLVYKGSYKDKINWEELQTNLSAKYPDLADRAFRSAKVSYLGRVGDWNDYVDEGSAYAEKYGDPDKYQLLNLYAGMLFYACEDSLSLNKFVRLFKPAVELEDVSRQMTYSYNYANLLYKTGNREEAITLFQKMLTYYKETEGRNVETLGKMKKGVKTW